MSFVLTDVGVQKKDYPNMLDHATAAEVNSRLLTLDGYYELARRVICRFAPRNTRALLLASDDAISYVAHRIMVGDWGYVPARSDIKTCRGYCGIMAIQDYLGMIAKQHNPISLDDGDFFPDAIRDTKTPLPEQGIADEDDQREAREVVNRLMDCLSPVQKSCITMRFFRNMSMQAIGNELDMTREGVRHSINEAMNKMREAKR